MFPPTHPTDAAAEPHRSGPTQDPAAADSVRGPVSQRQGPQADLSSLGASLMQDLMRFERSNEDRRELLEVLAACVRHTQAVAVRLAWGWNEMTLTVFPLDGLQHCPMPMAEFLASELGTMRVLAIDPAALRPPGDAQLARVGKLEFYGPLAPLLWAVALRGSRGDLLPELAGMAAYRVAPGLSLGGLPVPPAMHACINRLRRNSCNLRDLAEWNGIGRERAARLLNALYLQSGLIVSRTHPAATGHLSADKR